jgi:hypothetical protein
MVVAWLHQTRIDVDVSGTIVGEDHVGRQRSVPAEAAPEQLELLTDNRQGDALS